MGTEFDEQLKQRLIAFQTQQGLTADGIANTETWQALVTGTRGQGTATRETGNNSDPQDAGQVGAPTDLSSSGADSASASSSDPLDGGLPPGGVPTDLAGASQSLLMPPTQQVNNAASSPAPNDPQPTASQPTVVRLGPTIRPGDGTTAELRAEQERLRRELDTLHVSTIEPDTEQEYNRYVKSLSQLDKLLAERGNSTLADATITLTFDGTVLTMFGAVSASWPAVSGRPDAAGGFDYSPTRQHLTNVGPIPAGGYWIDPTQLVDLQSRWLYSWLYETAWGTNRITIHPFDSTHTFGRGGFFIHGGTTPGSAGCIDLTTSMESFARQLGALHPGVKVKVLVRYP